MGIIYSYFFQKEEEEEFEYTDNIDFKYNIYSNTLPLTRENIILHNQFNIN